MNKNQVGKFFKDSHGEVYRMVSYCEHPTASFENVRTQHPLDGAVGSLNLRDLEYINNDEAQELLAKALGFNQEFVPPEKEIIPKCPSCGNKSTLLVERRPNGNAHCANCKWEGPYRQCFLPRDY
jgi:predicted RNA-binding Zn-ribbon protein involved in translation (DUF1610 family)